MVKKEIKFICAGWPKCGTSTLDSILRQYPDIELPLIKEPHFFEWKYKYDKPHDVLLERYFTENENVIRGIIDPSIVNAPIKVEEIYKYFGNNVKIILMMKNPVNALYSDFKMKLRIGEFSDAYKTTKRDRYTAEQLFKNYLMKEKRYKYINRFNYSQYLKNLGFDESGKRNDNVKIIIFERFIKNLGKHINEILNFIGGIDDVEKKQFDIWTNEGNEIPKNYISCKLNGLLHDVIRKTRDYPITNVRVNKIITPFVKITMKEDNSKMDDRIRKRLEMYYCKEKKLIEKMIGENLDNDWF